MASSAAALKRIRKEMGGDAVVLKRAVVTERRPVQLPLSLGDKSAARLLLE